VLGGGIAGGNVVGEQIGVSASNLFQNRDFPVLNEYRSVLAYTLARTFAASTADIAYVFPGAQLGRYSFL